MQLKTDVNTIISISSLNCICMKSPINTAYQVPTQSINLLKFKSTGFPKDCKQSINITTCDKISRELSDNNLNVIQL